MKREEGYTLLELLVVLVIMSLIIAAIPGMALSGIRSMKFSGKVQAAVYRLSAAHNRAIASGAMVILTAAELENADQIEIQSSYSEKVIFFPDGSAIGAIITLKYSGRSEDIVIDAITGLAKETN